MLACQVTQVVEQLGVDLDHVTRCPLWRCCRYFGGGSFWRPLARGTVCQCGTAEVANVVDQRCSGMQRLPQTHSVKHMRQPVVAVLQQCEQWRTWRQSTRSQQLVEELQFVGQVADRGDFDHARHAFEGVQVAHQVVHLDAAARVGLPARQGRRGALDDVRAFFQEHFQQLFAGAFRLLGKRLGHLRLQRRAWQPQGIG